MAQLEQKVLDTLAAGDVVMVNVSRVNFMVKPFDRNRLLSSIKKHIAMA